MENLRDMALADYEHWPHDRRTRVRDEFNRYLDNGNPIPRPPNAWRNASEIYRKRSLDFEEFVTLKYISDNAETVIECDGCSSLITGKPYFICNDCFDDLSKRSTFNLCCQCYLSKSFDHEHTSFSNNLSVLVRSRRDAATKQDAVDRRNELIDASMMDFGEGFIELAKVIITNDKGWENRFGATLKLDKEKKLHEMSSPLKKLLEKWNDKKGGDKKNMSRTNATRYKDLFGAEPSLVMEAED